MVPVNHVEHGPHFVFSCILLWLLIKICKKPLKKKYYTTFNNLIPFSILGVPILTYPLSFCLLSSYDRWIMPKFSTMSEQASPSPPACCLCACSRRWLTDWRRPRGSTTWPTSGSAWPCWPSLPWCSVSSPATDRWQPSELLEQSVVLPAWWRMETFLQDYITNTRFSDKKTRFKDLLRAHCQKIV